MALSKLDSLYMAVVAEHSKYPHHQGKIADVEQINLNNPTCGDVISLSVKFDSDNKVEDIAFVNSGCTISTASASMMTDVVLGKSKEEILELAEVFSEMVQGQENAKQDELGDAAFLAGVAKFPQRIKCATLPWNALKKAIEE
ncbi:putative iron-sulfur cluster assembly scaffold protein for SUF system, SufE2 [Streptococcus sp. DD10]|uniref:Fe-S cluster assembly sulfur transfer protein SufU n=1 Tax=Streptococcus sp. DD10 TaxID=1777878 RepID=UPI00079BA215|nr:SUF system NifU family Fe-S cluster assembly protein [Streptococcus sp. DD10]KXT72475.1 putative iron-sulfur cluster assembly scaffold protein for SUF system, SufE2 [Streptococcus sp. DD10]